MKKGIFLVRFATQFFAVTVLAISITVTACKKPSSGNGGGSNPPSDPSTGGGVMVTDTERYLGVNYNESLHEINPGELSRSKTKWVRGFLDIFHHYDNNNLNSSPRITEYLKLKGQGYKTCLNLKFNFKTRPYPAVNSSAWSNYINYVDQVLDKVILGTDVIVVGNEPFIESETNTWDEPLNTFYKALATRVQNYLVAKNLQRPIFIGSFDNMYQSGRQGNAGINNLLAWVKANSWIAGVSMHIHHDNNPEITTAINYVHDKLRDNQKIIITEYSLMKWWRSNLNADITPEFVNAANASTTDFILPPPPGITKCWQYIDYALKNPRKKEEWDAFHQYNPWLEIRKDYLCNSFKLFKASNKFWFATYAMRQSYPVGADFTVDTDPWIMNSLFTGRSVELLPTGEAEGRYSFFQQFADINAGVLNCN
ncbi:hypothetical protein [Lacibacter sp.]|uniref:hypothetical protein n=1 Tax=Lacibacter sp. TaxID=1915409 RepID=UPI002B4AE747|nr:hypothetical protein [Lacibacter sp.]HLP37686.1 hypothetical protein [Lacibacter sp.]